MSLLTVNHISKSFDRKSLSALKNINFDINSNEILSIIGPSGTGKTTLLKIIAGELDQDSGNIEYTALDSSEISFISQDYSLDESKTIYQNLSEVLVGEKEDFIRTRVRNVIELFGLQYKDHRYPCELSFGQLQRAKMARSLVTYPKLLLMDEPFSNLDDQLKRDIKEELFELAVELKFSIVIVTHNLDDAFSDSTRVAILADGKIKQIDSPQTLYTNPSNSYSAMFSGEVNLLSCKVTNVEDSKIALKHDLTNFYLSKFSEFVDHKFAYVVIRPEHATVSSDGEFSGVIQNISFKRSHQTLTVKIAGKNDFLIRASIDNNFDRGQKVSFSIDRSKLQAISL